LPSEERVIPLSKTNLATRLICGFVLIVVSFWLLALNLEAIESGDRYRNPVVIAAGATALVLIMLFFSSNHIKLLFDNTPGFVINPDGIHDNSHASAFGFIPWVDVSGITRFKVHKHWHVAILVRDVDKYLTGNVFVKSKRKAHLKAAGTPIFHG